MDVLLGLSPARESFQKLVGKEIEMWCYSLNHSFECFKNFGLSFAGEAGMQIIKRPCYLKPNKPRNFIQG